MLAGDETNMMPPFLLLLREVEPEVQRRHGGGGEWEAAGLGLAGGSRVWVARRVCGERMWWIPPVDIEFYVRVGKYVGEKKIKFGCNV